MLYWDPGLDMCPKFPPHPLGFRWWTCKCYPGRRAGYVCFYCFSVQFPSMNPVEVPPAPSAVRWSHMCILPRYGLPHCEPCLSLAEPSAVSAVYWSHPRLTESTPETSICSAALGHSICVISIWYLLCAGCGFHSVPDLGTLSQCYVRNSSGCISA